MPEREMRELLEKYLNGSATPEEVGRVDRWYEAMRNKEASADLTDDERRELRDIYWARLRKGMNGGRPKQRYLWGRISAVAAAFMGAIAVAYFILPIFNSSTESQLVRSNSLLPESEVNIIDNTTQAVRHFSLSDGSTVSLHPGSRLGIANDFDQDARRVTLSGRASFKVARDESRPFYVIADEVVTKVLGTSFTVVAYPGQGEITVEVSSGAVGVYAHQGVTVDDLTDGVIIKSNQQAVYSRMDKKVSRMLIKEPKVVISEKEINRIRFDGTAVSEIFRALEKMYGVEIVFDEAVFSECSMTTSVSRNDLFEKIDVICEITGARYTVEDGRILIHGTGCN